MAVEQVEVKPAGSVVYNDGMMEQVANVPRAQTFHKMIFVWLKMFILWLACWVTLVFILWKTDFPYLRDWWWVGIIPVIFVPLVIASSMAPEEYDARRKWATDLVEMFTGVDIDGDGLIGKEPREATLHTRIVNEHGNLVQNDIRHADDFMLVVREYSNNPNMKFTFRSFAELGISEINWRDIITDLKKLDIVVPINPRDPHSTVYVTDGGKQWFVQAVQNMFWMQAQLRKGDRTNEDNYALPPAGAPARVNAYDTTSLPAWDLEKTGSGRHTATDRQKGYDLENTQPIKVVRK